MNLHSENLKTVMKWWNVYTSRSENELPRRWPTYSVGRLVWGDSHLFFFFLPLRDTPRYWGRRLFRPGVSRSFGAGRQLTSQSTKRLAQRWMQSLLSSRWRAKEFTSMSESLKWKCLQGLTFKARSMNRTPRSLILSLPSDPKIG